MYLILAEKGIIMVVVVVVAVAVAVAVVVEDMIVRNMMKMMIIIKRLMFIAKIKVINNNATPGLGKKDMENIYMN